jgi:hypothetical protein
MAPTLKRISIFLMESMCKNMGTNLNSKTMIGDKMVVDPIVLITCMLPFSNPLLDFDSMSKILTLTNMPFCKY